MFHKTSQSLLATYTIILILYLLPLAASYFATEYFPHAKSTPAVQYTTISSPFAAAFEFPLFMDEFSGPEGKRWQEATGPNQFLGYAFSDMKHFAGYLVFAVSLNLFLFAGMIWMFNSRWRVSNSTE